MRKSLVAALAAATALGGTSAAMAQGTGATLQVSVKPGKAGTKKKPKASSLKLVLTNGNQALTAKTIDILLPKNLVVSGKGLKTCSQSALEAQGPTACQKAARAGSGTANALVGVNTGNPAPISFRVTAFLLSKKSIGFYLEGQGIGVNVLAVGKLGKARGAYGSKLSILIPPVARQSAPGVFSGLVSLNTTLKLNKGKNHLLATNGCPKSKKLPFAATIGFEANPNPPATPTVTAKSTAKCS